MICTVLLVKWDHPWPVSVWTEVIVYVHSLISFFLLKLACTPLHVWGQSAMPGFCTESRPIWCSVGIASSTAWSLKPLVLLLSPVSIFRETRAADNWFL